MTTEKKPPLRTLFCIGINQNFFDSTQAARVRHFQRKFRSCRLGRLIQIKHFDHVWKHGQRGAFLME